MCWLSLRGRLQLESCPLAHGSPQPWPPPQPSAPPSGQAEPVQGTQLPKSHPQPSQALKPGSAPGTSPSPRTSAPAPGDRAGCPSLATVHSSRWAGHKLQDPEPVPDVPQLNPYLQALQAP